MTVKEREDKGWPASMKCWATGDLSSLRLMALLCSMMRVLIGLFVLPTYCLLHGHEMRYTTLDVLHVVSCLIVNSFPVAVQVNDVTFFVLFLHAAHVLQGKKPLTFLRRPSLPVVGGQSARTRKSLTFLAL